MTDLVLYISLPFIPWMHALEYSRYALDNYPKMEKILDLQERVGICGIRKEMHSGLGELIVSLIKISSNYRTGSRIS